MKHKCAPIKPCPRKCCERNYDFTKENLLSIFIRDEMRHVKSLKYHYKAGGRSVKRTANRTKYINTALSKFIIFLEINGYEIRKIEPNMVKLT